ncbi:uncharacterized protein [Atheta coriaria]|uniref:uncharacterized protein n=1 Tax=Dalotia coriaria TaxID=877792 RepID=UPI0031F3C02D
MSRRYRLEQKYLQQLRAEAEEEEDKVRQNQHSSTAPVLWATLNTGFSIHDVVDADHQDILEMLQEHYIPHDVLCRNTELIDDPVSLKSMLDHILYTLKDTTSIKIVKNEENGSETLVGVLLLRVSRKADFDRVFSRTILQDGDARKKCIAIQTALSRKLNIYETYNCESFLRYYILCIKKEFRNNGLGYQLMRVGLDVARSLNIHVASGIFSSFNLQRNAKKLGFKLIQEVSYTSWRDKSNNELIFSDPGSGNYTCAFMICDIPAETILDPQVVHRLSPYEKRVVPQPRTRAEKRAHLYKHIPKTRNIRFCGSPPD